METKKERMLVSFAAIDPYIERNIVLPTEKVLQGRDIVEWGDGNAYPDYCLELYRNCSTLKSVIDGTVDFIAGDDVTILPLRGYDPGVMNRAGDTIAEQVRDLGDSYETHGGFALQVIRGADGKASEVYVLDMRYIRSNKDNTVFYYSEKWQSRGAKDAAVYPKFLPDLDWFALTPEERDRHASSVLFVKNVRKSVYPLPPYAAAIKACEIERCIDDYHLNVLDNGFAASAMVNFNNGMPSDEMKKSIERDFSEKFAGHSNAGRVIFSWNRDKESAAEIVPINVQDFGDRYKALATHSRQQIFTAFRATPVLFGIPTDNNGFSADDYENAFRLYNRTHVRPVQRMIADAYDKIYGAKGVLTITPFSIDEGQASETIVK